ncbi:MAG: hypothetical protein WC915_02975 [archaeon]|jgi:hypothetical protein
MKTKGKNTLHIQRVFEQEKKYSLHPRKTQQLKKIETTKKLIPFAVSEALNATKTKTNSINLINRQLIDMLENKTLGPALNLAMKNKLDKLFENETPTPQEIEIADEIAVIDSIIGDEKHTQKFLNIFGHTLLNIYSREKN